MPTWLTVLLASVGGGIVLLLLGLMVLRFLLRRFLGGLLGGLTGGTPVRVKTMPKPPDQDWFHGKDVKQAREFFEREKFRWVNDLALDTMEDVLCVMLVREDGSAAVVYDHKKVGVWVDLVARYGERGGLTVSNAAMGSELESPPFSQKVHMPGASCPQLWEIFQERFRTIPREDRRPLTAENVARTFEQAYADEIDWRNAQGGVKEEEVRKIARRTPGQEDASDENIESATSIQQAIARAGLMEGLQERIKDGMTAQDLLRFRPEDLVIVHDRLSEEDLLGYVSSYIEDEQYEVVSLPDACQDRTPLEAFEELQELLPEVVRFEKVATLDFPLTTHAYRPPNGRIPIELFPHKHRPKDEDDC